MLLPVDLMRHIAERRILEAIERGELDDLPGAGRPQVLDDDAMVPPELRAGYRLLRNAGCLPPELELRRDIAAARRRVHEARTSAARWAAYRRLESLERRLELGRGRALGLFLQEASYSRLLERTADSPSEGESGDDGG